MGKKSKIDTSDIINIKWLFKNREYNTEQSKKHWKQENRESILEYHKNYNEEKHVGTKLSGLCLVCGYNYANIRQHEKTKFHKSNL